MAVRIKVTDSSKRPIEGAEVQIRWYSGTSIGRTDANGIYDSGVSNGTADEIKVNGRQVDRDTWLEDRIYAYSAY